MTLRKVSTSSIPILKAEDIQKSKENLKVYLECEARTSNLDSLNDQIEQMKKTVWDQLGTLDKLKNTTENQIQDIEAKLWEKYDPNFSKTMKETVKML